MADTILACAGNGGRICAEACPGAGKTTLLKTLCRKFSEKNVLVLAYNTLLSAELCGTLPDNATCYTFHKLCSICIGSASDDQMMDEQVARVKRGEILPCKVPAVDILAIDEAQDVRGPFVELILCLGLIKEGTSVVCVGDRNQLVYDFDPDFPASLELLLRPEVALRGVGGWKHVSLEVTHRLTAPMCTIVNGIFGTNIRAAEGKEVDERMGQVEVRATKNRMNLYALLADVFRGEEKVLLLVDRKKHNRPLMSLVNKLNALSKTRVSVHGVDEEEQGGDEGWMRTHQCASYWSAKGLQAAAVIVLIPGQCGRNPLYVALTRAFRRLVVVLDAKEPHAAFCRAAMKTAEEGRDVVAAWDAFTDSVICEGARAGDDRVAASLEPRVLKGSSHLRDASTLGPRKSLASHIVRSEIVVGKPHADDARYAIPVVVRACLVHEEFKKTGKVRAMEDVLHPLRLDWDSAHVAIANGLVSRWVTKFTTDEQLLDAKLRRVAEKAYSEMEKESIGMRAFIVALAVVSWDNFDGLMRRHAPLPSVPEQISCSADWLASLLASEDTIEYDTVLCTPDLFCRVHASTPFFCIHVVWEESPTSRFEAAVRACLHPSSRCRLFCLGDHRVIDVSVKGDDFLDIAMD